MVRSNHECFIQSLHLVFFSEITINVPVFEKSKFFLGSFEKTFMILTLSFQNRLLFYNKYHFLYKHEANQRSHPITNE